MRAITIILCLVLFSTADAAELKTVQDFYKESEKLYAQAEKAKSLKKKTGYLKELKKSFDKELALYEKANPQEGPSEEHDVSRLYYTLNPVFELAEKKKLSETDCKQAKIDIAPVDPKSMPDSPRLPRTQEAMRWARLICK